MAHSGVVATDPSLAPAVISAASGLIGALIGSTSTLPVTRQAQRRAAQEKDRAERVEAAEAALDAVGVWRRRRAVHLGAIPPVSLLMSFSCG